VTGEITVGGQACLSFRAGAGLSGRSLARLAALRGSPGWRVRGSAVQEWRFSGIVEEAGTAFLYGPRDPSTSLEEVLCGGLSDGLPRIRLLADSLITLSERLIPLPAVQSDAVLLTQDGGVLFLPPEVMRELRSLRPFGENRERFEALNHPDLTGAPQACFSLTAALYRLAAGRFPFDGETPEEVHEQARKRIILDPAQAAPGATEQFSAVVMAGLGRRPGTPLDIAAISHAVEGWIREHPVRALTEQESGKIRALAAARGREAERTFRRRAFWERNWKTVLISAAAAVVVAAAAGSVLKGVLAPRPTRGFTPEQVVRAFYGGMNSLDHALMQAAVAGGAGRQAISEVTNVYVISRVTLGYEGRSGVVPADEWDRQGKPALPPPLTVYGVTELTLDQEQGPPAPVFRARYVKWAPVSADPETQPGASLPRYEGTRVSERITMRRDRGYWVITRFDPLPDTQ
jgi:hypothetical protein